MPSRTPLEKAVETCQRLPHRQRRVPRRPAPLRDDGGPQCQDRGAIDSQRQPALHGSRRSVVQAEVAPYVLDPAVQRVDLDHAQWNLDVYLAAAVASVTHFFVKLVRAAPDNFFSVACTSQD